MKANELMIGSYVKFLGKVRKIKSIIKKDTGIEISFEGKNPVVVSLDVIEPIPITPEILEKNGFTMNTKAKSKKAWQISDNELYVSWWNGRLNTYYKPEVTKSMNHINTDCVYVHELQHVLKLCGIEKEITI